MKELVVGIVTATLITAGGLAAGQGQGLHFTDINEDGVCDYAYAGCAFVDVDGDGICDNYSMHRGRTGAGKGFQNGMGYGCGNRGGCRR